MGSMEDVESRKTFINGLEFLTVEVVPDVIPGDYELVKCSIDVLGCG
jgi:hypothetical protein